MKFLDGLFNALDGFSKGRIEAFLLILVN